MDENNIEIASFKQHYAEPRNLLENLAGDLWQLANRWAVPVVQRQDPNQAPDPFGQFVYAQRTKQAIDYQLPEPILHPIPNPDVLVVGLNPGFGETEIIPSLGTSLSDYVDWYSNRFDHTRRDDSGRPTATYSEGSLISTRFVSHYAKVERWLEPACGPVALGRNAVYCDAIPWKWRNSDRSVRPQLSGKVWNEVWQDAYIRVSRIVTCLKPRVIVTLGEPGTRFFNRAPSESPRALPLSVDSWDCLLIPVVHPNRRGTTAMYWSIVAKALKDAVGT